MRPPKQGSQALIEGADHSIDPVGPHLCIETPPTASIVVRAHTLRLQRSPVSSPESPAGSSRNVIRSPKPQSIPAASIYISTDQSINRPNCGSEHPFGRSIYGFDRFAGTIDRSVDRLVGYVAGSDTHTHFSQRIIRKGDVRVSCSDAQTDWHTPTPTHHANRSMGLAKSPAVAASEPPSMPRPASAGHAGLEEQQHQPTEAAAAASRWGRGQQQQLDRRMRRRVGVLAGACWALVLGLVGLLGRGPACVVEAFQGPFVVGGGQAR